MRQSLTVVLVAALLGCQGSTEFNAPGDEHADGGSTTHADALIPYPDLGSCGGQSIPIKLVQKGDIPDLFMVVDRSGSMMMPVNIFQWQLGSKWDVMRKTISSLVSTYYANIRFGLSLFPSDSACGAGKINNPLVLGGTAAIQQTLAVGPDGNTPTHTTLAQVRSYLAATPLGKGPRYVLLATDGMPNCADGQTADGDTSAETLAEVKLLVAAGIKTFVLGFGDVVAADPTLLTQLAQAGGVPNTAGPLPFFAATDEAQLQKALFTIAGGIIPPPCTYSLTTKPTDPERVTVTFDGKPVPRSKSSVAGWNYTSNGSEISFFGTACDQLRTGSVKEVKFLFGCKGPVIE
jgi:hypothetical protein